MDKNTAEALNAVQIVLRHLMLSLAAVSRADLGHLGQLLEESTTTPNIGPIAQSMLADLAAGATALAITGQRKQ